MGRTLVNVKNVSLFYVHKREGDSVKLQRDKAVHALYSIEGPKLLERNQQS